MSKGKEELTNVVSLHINQLLDSYTISEVCQILKISAASIYQWRNKESLITKRKYIAIQDNLREWQGREGMQQQKVSQDIDGLVDKVNSLVVELAEVKMLAVTAN
ncbi:helix-turn-helix domain-containing protein [Viridibacillus arvi]|uniref:helix-turn-helix domain-containing protein n=1 Tax=Viridibacillus arvi TaxID=263475 RepID=UPI0036B2BF3A